MSGRRSLATKTVDWPQRARKVRRDLAEALKQASLDMGKIDSRVEFFFLRGDATGSVEVSEDDTSSPRFTFAPMAMKLPERPKDSNLEIYVCVEGFIELDLALKDPPYTVLSFGTRLAYFRLNKDTLDHILGVHYDFDGGKRNHPIFHAQLDNRNESRSIVKRLYPMSPEHDGTNYMKGVLHTARIPTALLDLFATLGQLSADHLLSTDASGRTLTAFNRLTQACQTLYAQPMLAKCGGSDDNTCTRAGHWYF